MSRYFQAQSAALTPLNALPTTTAGISLWNGESQTSGVGKFYVIDSVFAYFALSQALATVASFWIQMNTGVVAAPSTGTNITNIKSSYGEAYPAGGVAVVRSGNTVVNDFWTPYGTSLPVQNTADQWTTIDTGIEGALLQPGFLFSMHLILASTPVATSAVLGIAWRELAPTTARSALPGLL